MVWMVIGGATLFSVIVAGVVVAMLGGDEPEAPRPVPAPVATEASEPVPQPVPEKNDATLLAEAEPVVRKFLEATRIEDMLPLVRNPEVAESRMRRHYPGGTIQAPGLAAFNTASQLSRLGPIISVRVSTRDYDSKSVAFFDTPEGIKIDWESWAGWSEMPWEEFLASKPTSPKVFRVKLSEVHYFNFAFSDEEKWRSYRLESPDGEHVVFGYAERGTVLDSRLRLSPDEKNLALTLALKFPENPPAGNQVIIGKFITDGWVVETGEPP